MSENKTKKNDSRSVQAQAQLKEENVTMTNGVVHATGASAFADLFNSLVDDIQKKAQKEADRPRYRFLNNLNEKINTNLINPIIASHEFQNSIDDLEEKLSELKYHVEIIENLDCKDVTQESRYFIRISNKNGIYIDIDLLTYQNKIKDFTFNEQDYIEEQLAKIVGSSTNETKMVAECIADYIAHIMYFRELYTLTYKKIGWDVYDWKSSGYIFKYDKIYSTIPMLKGKGKSSYTEGLEVNSSDPYMEFEWIKTTIDLLNKHAYCDLLMGAGISGVIRQLLPYTKETNININIYGKPASGKSTISHYILSIFGNPEKIEGSFTDTTNSMEEIRVRRPILPYVLDERMLKIENESEKSKKQTLLMDIFREYEGKVKERLGKQYEEESGERTYGPIISSSVQSMMELVFKSDDLGQYRRFIEFNIGGKEDGLLFDGEEEAEDIEHVAYKDYGFGIRIIVDYMLHMTDLLIENEENLDLKRLLEKRFEAINKDIMAKLKEKQKEEGIKGLTSSSKRFALIILSYKILRESLIYYLYSNVMEERELDSEDDAECLKEIVAINDELQTLYFVRETIEKADSFEKIIYEQDIIRDNSWEVLDLLIDNLVLKTKKLNQIQKPKNDNALYDYILQNDKYFIKIDKWNPKTGKELVNKNGDILGVYTLDNKKMTLYTLLENQLDMFWYMESIPEPDFICEFIKEVKTQQLDWEKARDLGKTQKYNALTNKAQGNTGRTHKKIDDVTVYFSKKDLELIRPTVEDNDQEEGES